jgi:hypothetical protein
MDVELVSKVDEDIEEFVSKEDIESSFQNR